MKFIDVLPIENLCLYPAEILKKEKKANIKNWNIVYDRNITFFRWIRILGFFPIIREKNGGKIRYSLFSYESLYSAIAILIGSAISIYFYYIVISNMLSKNFNFDEILLYGTLVTYPLLNNSIIFAFIETPKLAVYLNLWDVFQESLERVIQSKVSYKPTNGWLYLHLLCLFGCLTILGTRQKQYFELFEEHNLDSTIHFIMLSFFIAGILILTGFVYLWFLLNSCVKEATKYLIEDIESLKWLKNKSLKKHLHLWVKLAQLCEYLGSVISINLMYNISMMFFYALPLIYTGIYSFKDGNKASLVPALHTLFFISLCIDIGHTTAEKVGPEFKNRLSALLFNQNVMSSGCEDEIVKFIQTIVGGPPIIKTAGILTFDRGINVSIYSSVITYMALMIQFAPDKKDQLVK